MTRRLSTLLLFFLFYTFAPACYKRFDRRGYTGQNTGFVSNDDKAEREKSRRWKEGYVYVTKVIDGDTFWVDDGAKEIKVRFIGIDAPELRNSAHKKKGYFAVEAKDYVTKLTEYQWVRLELDVRKIDPYRRLLAYIYLEDGTFLNADLVAKGYAVVDTHPPNVKYVDLFVELQRAAREDGLGLWAE